MTTNAFDLYHRTLSPLVNSYLVSEINYKRNSVGLRTTAAMVVRRPRESLSRCRTESFDIPSAVRYSAYELKQYACGLPAATLPYRIQADDVSVHGLPTYLPRYLGKYASEGRTTSNTPSSRSPPHIMEIHFIAYTLNQPTPTEQRRHASATSSQISCCVPGMSKAKGPV
jgi:hypothetical protein